MSNTHIYIQWSIAALVILIIAFFFYRFKHRFQPNPTLLLEGPIGSSILKFTLPIFFGMLFQQFYATVDFIIIGQFVGKGGLAAVSLSATILMLAVSFIIGITMGASILVAQYFGAKQYHLLKKVISTTYIAMLIGGLLSTLFGVIFAEKIIIAMQTPAEIVNWATEYMKIMFVGIPILFLYNSISSILRGVGDSLTPLFYLLITTAFNIIFDLIFVGLLGLGVAGAGWSTVASQAIALLLAIRFLKKHPLEYLNLRLKEMVFHWPSLKKSLALGLPAGIQQSINSVAFLLINKTVNGFGVAAAAAYATLGRIDPVIMMPAMCFSGAIATFAGQNLGANQLDRIPLGIKATNKMSIIYCLITIPLVVIFRYQLPLLFVDATETETIQYSANWFLLVGWAYLPFTLLWIYHGALRGLGHSMVPMILSIVSLWVIRIPLTTLLASRIGLNGVWISAAIAWVINYLLTILYWHSGKWQKSSIR